MLTKHINAIVLIEHGIGDDEKHNILRKKKIYTRCKVCEPRLSEEWQNNCLYQGLQP